ncbi:hypothetical protein LMG31506_04252 [Cupriavidus yeoncheonensis]|uniref:Diguanylate cyclase n=2 Tax=Cupriavidus yeoncheonensis TaxID=1462994 RepID=A0A916IWV0_9BURK|nr:hypothetical protein LMG31506_04252 [Cupriavidus yeoncheonensis]
MAIAAVVFGGLIVMKKFDSLIHTIYYGNTKPITHLANIRAAETNIRRLQWRILAQRDPAQTEKLLAQIREKLALSEREWAHYYPAGVSSPDEAELARQLAADMPRFVAAVHGSLDRLGTGHYDDAMQWLLTVIPFLDHFDELVTKDINANAAQATGFVGMSESTIQVVTGTAVAMLALVVVGVMTLALRLMRQRDDAVQESIEHLLMVDQVYKMSTDSVIITDKAGTITKVNPAFTKLTGYTEAEVLGRNPSMWSSGRQPPEFYQEMFRCLEADGSWTGEIWNRRKCGELYLESISISRIGGAAADEAHYAAICSDITRQKMEEEQREYLATHDPLTDLPNRLLFNERLKHAIARAHRASSLVAVMFVDLDHFKEINDSLGHQAGDETLRTVAQRLRGGLREADTVARLGGDEFAVILEDLHAHFQIEPIARKLLAAVGEPILAVGHAVQVTPSIGISVYPDDGVDPRQLVERADHAMYAAKRAGKNAVRFFEEAVAIVDNVQ